MKTIKEEAMSCYNTYFQCDDFDCPCYDHCYTGKIKNITDFELELLFPEKGGLKTDKEKQKQVIQKLEKQLKTHWKNTEEERKRTHTGIMYERFVKEMIKKIGDR